MSGKPAARVTDLTSCPLSGHGVNPIASGSPDVFLTAWPQPVKMTKVLVVASLSEKLHLLFLSTDGSPRPLVALETMATTS